MDLKRLYHTLRLHCIWGARGRAEYLRKHNVFKSVGEHCSFMPRKVPLYAKLIKFGDYVIVASNVGFHTHDAVHSLIGVNNNLLSGSLKDYKFNESIGCIEVGNHVYIAAGAVIEHGVKIGDNVIITARSVVTNDIPSNSIVRGNPAKVVCSLSQYLMIRANKKTYPSEFKHKMGKYISPELENWLWDDFYKSHER